MLTRRYWKYFIYVIMTLYIAYVAISMYSLNTLTNNGQNYAIQTSREIKELRGRANEFSTSMPLLLASPQLSLSELLTRVKEESDAQQKIFTQLKARFLGNPDIMVQLGQVLDEIAQKKREAAQKLHANISYELATTYYQHEIAPLLTSLRLALDAAEHSVDVTHNNVHEQMHERFKVLIFFAIVLGVIIVIMTMLYDRRIALSSRELAYSNELFRQLARGVDEIFIIAINQDNFEFVSQNSARIIGLPVGNLGDYAKKLYGVFKPEAAKWLKDILSSPPKAEYHAEKDLPGIDDAHIFTARIYTIQLPAKDQRRFILVINDQTEDMHHQLALNHALEEAKSASAAKSKFLSHMSHEIRTPMNAIIGMTTIALSRLGDTERVEDCLKKISNSSRHLLGIINDVLDMSKIESGKLAINEDKFNLHKTIENIRSLMQPQILARSQTFEILSKNVIEENLLGDAMRLRQVLINILSNAIKFTPDGGEISLRIGQSPPKSNMTRLSFTITDNGIGMSKEFLKRIYVPFEQAHSSVASKYGGTGLGMPITANLVAMMGGTINVESEEGKGTAFEVELPFEISSEPACLYNDLPALKVLVVDDDQDTCENAVLLLSQIGLKPSFALGGEQALEMLQQAQAAEEPFDVCLIDWRIPDMDGAETGRRIRAICGGEIIIIITSAHDWTEIEKEAEGIGLNGFIPKPFFASSLYDGLCQATKARLEAIKKESADLPKEQKKYDFSGKRILLAEDNEFNREIAMEFLDMVNAEVQHAPDGQEAVEKFTASPQGYYDIILMDIQMPHLDGYESTRHIRASNHPDAASVPIIAMTANAFSEDVALAMAAGMNAHLAKPIDINALYQMLHDALYNGGDLSSDKRQNRRQANSAGSEA